mmetsp:Transcript_15307/g.39003  ORF Transcript_15307/g.39003 Transcript_15307/m.39003 type:complete len:83 (+) Transcript_15307:1259-1507(+)
MPRLLRVGVHHVCGSKNVCFILSRQTLFEIALQMSGKHFPCHLLHGKIHITTRNTQQFVANPATGNTGTGVEFEVFDGIPKQ